MKTTQRGFYFYKDTYSNIYQRRFELCLNDDNEYKEDNTIRSRLHEICVHNILLLNCFDKSFRSGKTSNRQTVCVPVAAPTSVGLPVVHIHTQNITQVVGSTIGSIISPLSFSTTIIQIHITIQTQPNIIINNNM